MSTQIERFFEEQQMIIRLNAEVNSDTIFALCQRLNEAVGYYGYKRVVLEINSLGGSVDALFHFIDRLKGVRTAHPGFILETRALIDSCSAAAFMCSMGTIGHRSARQDTRMVYHNARLGSPDQTPATGDRLGRISSDLKRMDSRMLIELFRHIYPKIDKALFDLLHACLYEADLSDESKVVQIFEQIGSADASGTFARLIHTSESSDEGRDRVLEEIRRMLEDLASMHHNNRTYEEIATIPLSTANGLGWLYGQMKRFQRLFAQDRRIGVEEAITLRLIDRIDGTDENDKRIGPLRQSVPGSDEGCFNISSLSEDERLRHILATGETGSGKTMSVIVPAIRSFCLGNRSKRRSNPALIIDPKGELLQLLQKLMSRTPDRLHDFDLSRDRLWLFDGRPGWNLGAMQIVDIIFSLMSFTDSWHSRDRSWIDAAKTLLATLVEIERAAMNTGTWRRKTTTQFWLDFLSWCTKEFTDPADPRWTSNSASLVGMDYLQRNLHVIGLLSNSLHSFVRNTGKVQAGMEVRPQRTGWTMLADFVNIWLPGLSSTVYGRILEYANMPMDTYNSVTFTLTSMTSPYLDRQFSSKVSVNPFEAPAFLLDVNKLIDDGVVTIYKPPQVSVVTETIGRILKESFFRKLLVDDRLNSRKVPPFYYVCDEFQRFVTSDEFSGEQSFLDRCRAYKVCCILATQSIASLQYRCTDHQRGLIAVRVMLNNIANQFFFRTADGETRDTLRGNLPSLEGNPHVIDARPLTTLAPGECYYLLAGGGSGRGRMMRHR